VFGEAERLANLAGIALVQRLRRVVDVAPLEDGSLRIVEACGVAETFDRVVLCTGNLASHTFPQLVDHPRFFNDPYPSAAWRKPFLATSLSRSSAPA
jgi:hypothetical protein